MQCNQRWVPVFEAPLRNLLVLTMIATALGACGQPLPAEKSAYVGEWQGTDMFLLITQEGTVAYERLDEGVNKTIDAPIQEFQGDSFVVGIGPMSTTFVVSNPPHREGKEWKMTVDGIELTKVQ